MLAKDKFSKAFTCKKHTIPQHFQYKDKLPKQHQPEPKRKHRACQYDCISQRCVVCIHWIKEANHGSIFGRIKSRLHERILASNGDTTHLRVFCLEKSRGVLRRKFCAINLRDKKNESKKICRKRRQNNAMYCVTNSKTGYTLRYFWREVKACREKFNKTNVLRPYFLRSHNILFENLSLATRVTLSFYSCGENF